MTSSANRRGDHLVEPEWLDLHRADPNLRIVDMRGLVQTETLKPGVQSAHYSGARKAYLQGHIPNAVYLDWTRDIIDPNDPAPVQIAPPDRFAHAMSIHGIGNDTLVVAYDDHPASQFATRLWWALQFYGHNQVRVLNGGWNRWLREGRPISVEVPSPAPEIFTPHIQPDWRSTAEEVLQAIQTRSRIVVDARDDAQYTGAVRRGPRGGHIPGAIHLPRERLFTSAGEFLPDSDLRAAVRDGGIPGDQPVTAYCNGGVAATSVLFALHLVGFDDLSNYDGSWNEWGARQDLPVE